MIKVLSEEIDIIYDDVDHMLNNVSAMKLNHKLTIVDFKINDEFSHVNHLTNEMHIGVYIYIRTPIQLLDIHEYAI